MKNLDEMVLAAALVIGGYFLYRLYKGGTGGGAIGNQYGFMTPAPAQVPGPTARPLSAVVEDYSYNPTAPAGSPGAFDPYKFYGNGGM